MDKLMILASMRKSTGVIPMVLPTDHIDCNTTSMASECKCKGCGDCKCPCVCGRQPKGLIGQ